MRKSGRRSEQCEKLGPVWRLWGAWDWYVPITRLRASLDADACLALAASLTIHARQDGGMGICNDFANATNPCVPAGVQLGMAYTSPVFGESPRAVVLGRPSSRLVCALAWIGFIISWIDKFPGAVKVTARYPITKAPSSHFAAYAHDLDGKYARPPVKASSRSRNNSGWSDVPLHC